MFAWIRRDVQRSPLFYFTLGLFLGVVYATDLVLRYAA